MEAPAVPLHLVSVAHPGTAAPSEPAATGLEDDDRRPGESASGARWRVRIPGALRDVVLVVLGALLALAADEWREGRERTRRAELALAAIRAELEANLTMVDSARAHHMRVRDTLRAYVGRRESPPPRVYLGGIIKPAPVTATAWDAARETGVLAELPYATVLRIAPVYETQARYRSITDGVLREVLNDVMRLGFEAVLRDRAAHWAAIDEDFSNRERVMAERYREALATLRPSRD